MGYNVDDLNIALHVVILLRALVVQSWDATMHAAIANFMLIPLVLLSLLWILLSFSQGHSQTSLTNELVQEVHRMSSSTKLAKAIPAIEQPLTYHLLFLGSEGLVMKKMTYEEISIHPSYQLEVISADSKKFKSYLESVRLQNCNSVYSVCIQRRLDKVTMLIKSFSIVLRLPTHPIQLIAAFHSKL